MRNVIHVVLAIGLVGGAWHLGRSQTLPPSTAPPPAGVLLPVSSPVVNPPVLGTPSNLAPVDAAAPVLDQRSAPDPVTSPVPLASPPELPGLQAAPDQDPMPALPPAATPEPPPAEAPRPDPAEGVDSFVERSQKEAQQAIANLTRERDELRSRLKRVEVALEKWRAVSDALQPGRLQPQEQPVGEPVIPPPPSTVHPN